MERLRSARRSSPTAAWARSSPAPCRGCAARGGEPARTGERRLGARGYIRAGAELIETNTFGANRRKLAAHYLEDEFERINSPRCGSRARPRGPGATSSSPARSARSATSSGRPGRAEPALRRAGVDPRGARRRPLHGRDVLRPRRARHRDRGGARRLVPADRGDDDLRRRRPDARRRVGRDSRRAARRARRRRGRREPRRRAGRGADRARPMQRDGLVLAALPNIGLASLAGHRIVYPHATPDYFAEFAAQARSARRGADRRLLRHDAAQIAAIRGALEEDRAPAAPLFVRERELPARRGAQRRRPASRGCSRAGSASSRSSSTRRSGAERRRAGRGRPSAPRVGQGDFVDVNDNPRARARMSGLMASVAIERAWGSRRSRT